MFKIKIEKEDRNEIDTFDVSDKQAFMGAISVLLDTMQKEVFEKAGIEMSEEKVYEDIDRRTGYVFSDREQFFSWLSDMKSNDLIDPYFDYDSFREEAADDYVRENTDDFGSVSDLLDAYDELKSDMDEIYYTADKWH